MIYFVRSGPAGPVKIGYAADDIPARIRELQCGNPEPLVLVRFTPGGRFEEGALHRHYASLRIRARGEWFNWCDTMLSVSPGDLAQPPCRKPRIQADTAAMSGMELLRAERGLMGRLSVALGLTRNAVYQWTCVPLERAPDVERITGIPRHRLRPDFWSAPSEEAAA